MVTFRAFFCFFIYVEFYYLCGKFNPIEKAMSSTKFQEIERKFLVVGDFRTQAYEFTEIRQGYLCRDEHMSVRVRIRGDKGYLTIKSKRIGISRFEWEKEIAVDEALALLVQSESGCIVKTRHLVKNTDGRHTWEVDEFHGDNEGLIVAEIELTDENEPFDRPDWLGREVSFDPRYTNSTLLKQPYKNWKT